MNARLQSFFDFQALELERFRAVHAVGKRGRVAARPLEEIERQVTLMVAEIEPAVRNRISLLIRNGQPMALVPLEDDSYCGGCHRRLTPSEARRVQGGDVISCERCNRIIYPQEQVVNAG